MASTVERLAQRKLISPPKWLPGCIAYETIMGSMAYGVSSDSSDMDVYGFCVPPKDDVFPHLRGEIPGFGRQLQRFEQFQQHHVEDNDALAGKGREYDLTIFSLVKFFQLAMENNPNIVDSLFTPRECVVHCNSIGERVREKRQIFLHKGAWHKFKGYAYSQVHKMEIKTPQEGSKRAQDIQRHGFDCYDDQETEFLTSSGWRKFDEVLDTDLVGSISSEGFVVFEKPNARIDKLYDGLIFTVEPYMTRCVVTENHSMLVSPCHRSPSTNYSYKYDTNHSDWKTIPLSIIRSGTRSWYHIRTASIPKMEEFEINDSYLALGGMYVAEGSTQFRNQKVKSIRLTQTANGKSEFFKACDDLIPEFKLRRYEYTKETIWNVPREFAERLYQDFGHGSKHKRLPSWCFNLSHRQAKLFWDHALLGDGSYTSNSEGEVYYTSNEMLGGDIQAMMIVGGWSCSVRGPYLYDHHPSFGEPPCPMWQVYLSKQPEAKAVDFKSSSRVQMPGQSSERKKGKPIKVEEVSGRRVVCFDMPSGTLVTRSQGKVAFQGNCKFGYHVVRLLDEIEQILTLGDLDLQRDRERLKAIRRGEWTLEQVKEFFVIKEKELESAYTASKLPHGPDEAAIKTLLLECLEAHYGSLESAITLPGQERALLAQIKALCEKAGV